jgi:hypothetical protein
MSAFLRFEVGRGWGAHGQGGAPKGMADYGRERAPGEADFSRSRRGARSQIGVNRMDLFASA